MTKCCFTLALAILIAGGGLLWAQEQAQEARTEAVEQAEAEVEVTETRAEPRPARVVQPWSRLDLTEEQRRQIARIRRQFLEEQRAARERQAVLAILTDEQKAELQEIEETEAAERRARRAERAAAANTAPEGQAEAAAEQPAQD